MARTRTLLGATAGVVGAAALLRRHRSASPPMGDAAGRSVCVTPAGPAPVAPTDVPDMAAPVGGGDAAAVVRQRSRAVLSPARAQAVVRAASWSETLLGLLAVIITLLLGPSEEPADPGDHVEGPPSATPRS